MKDATSIIAGGGAGIALLLTVRWEAIPCGEAVKIGVALALAIMGYMMYRGERGSNRLGNPHISQDSRRDDSIAKDEGRTRRGPFSPLNIADSLIYRLHGCLKFQRALSLLGSNLASVGVLAPTAVRTTCSVEFGTDLGMMRYVPSVNCSMRHSCSGAPVKLGTVTASLPSAAASVRSVSATWILK